MLLNFLRFVLWPTIQFILLTVSGALERNTYSTIDGKTVLQISIRSSHQIGNYYKAFGEIKELFKHFKITTVVSGIMIALKELSFRTIQ